MFHAAEAARHAMERQITLDKDAANPILSPATSPSHSNSPIVPSDEEGWDALFLEEDDDNLELDANMDQD